MPVGSLVMAGTGIKLVSHITLETQAIIKQADTVFFLVNVGAMADWIRALNPTAVSLHSFYQEGKSRLQTYQEMIDTLLDAVRQEQRVCALLYGHPGVFVTISHKAIAQARREGFRAWMLPGVSAVDCLYADLGIDPAIPGCHSYEATGFLLHKRQPDVTSHLILWQLGTIGHITYTPQPDITLGLQLLTEQLSRYYPPTHLVTLYEAAMIPTLTPLIHPIPLAQLPHTPITPATTLYIPPQESVAFDPEMMRRLGIDASGWQWPPKIVNGE